MRRILVLSAVAWFAVTLFSSWFVVARHCDKDKEPKVTQLRGRVVGKKLWVYQYKWLRRLFIVPGARLRVAPLDRNVRSMSTEEARIWAEENVRIVMADEDGYFDFGPMAPGTYGGTLTSSLSTTSVGFRFDIDPESAADALLIDASPAFYSTCAGWDFEAVRMADTGGSTGSSTKPQ